MFYKNFVILPKGTTVDTTNLCIGEIMHMEFDLYNVTYIQGFTYVLNVVCATTMIIWIFTTQSK